VSNTEVEGGLKHTMSEPLQSSSSDHSPAPSEPLPEGGATRAVGGGGDDAPPFTSIIECGYVNDQGNASFCFALCIMAELVCLYRRKSVFYVLPLYTARRRSVCS
jgi:hypothetical protein